MSKHKSMWLEAYLEKIIEIAGDDVPTSDQIKDARAHADKSAEPYFTPIPDEGDLG